MSGHIPQPSDICSVCGNGLVHIDATLDAARPSGDIDVERLLQ